MLFKVGSRDDVKTWNESCGPEKKINPAASVAMTGWYNYYFRTWEEANRAMELIGSENKEGKKISVEQVFRVELDRDSIINWSSGEAKDKWNKNISGDVIVKTLRSTKLRHQYHMIFLPALVAAVGRYIGKTDVEFDVSELASRDTVFDDKFYATHCGDPDETQATTKEFYDYIQSMVDQGASQEAALKAALTDGICKVPYVESIYWQNRDEVWASLGEEDATAYNPIIRAADGTPDPKQPKYTTTSPVLDACLGLATKTWTKPIWVRILFVNDPKVDAVYTDGTSGETKRRTLPVITEVFADEAAAREAASKDGGGEGAPATSKPMASGPALPASYASMNIPEAMFIVTFNNYVTLGQNDSQIAAQMGITDAEAAAWRAHLSKQAS